jgi:hypothetical protein
VNDFLTEFFAGIGPDAAGIFRELLEIGEMRMVADADDAEFEAVDYEIADLRLGCALNNWDHGQLTLALLDGYGFLSGVHECLHCFRLTDLGLEALEYLRASDGVVETDGEEIPPRSRMN